MIKQLLSSAFVYLLIFSLHAQNVGIGTTAPLLPLHVSRLADTALLLLENKTALDVNTSLGLYFKNGSYYTGGIRTTGTGTAFSRLSFYTFASGGISSLKERLSITDDGAVGMGTPAPASRLHVTAAADSNLFLLERQSAIATGSSTGMYFKNGNRFTGAVKTIGSGSSAARLAFYTYASIATSGLQERLTIRDDGNVGINSANPSAQLEVVGTAKFSQGTDDVAMEISGPIKMTGSSKPAFVLVCNTGNLTDAFTPTVNYVASQTYYNAVIIDNALCNYDPNAIVMVTPVGTPIAFAVVYDTNISKWKITIDHNGQKENGCYGLGTSNYSCGSSTMVFFDYLPKSLLAGQKFNIMIFKQ